jgi:hypothetical protein
MIGTFAAWVTTTLASHMPGGGEAVQLAYAAAIVGTLSYVVGLAASFQLPEPKQEALPD